MCDESEATPNSGAELQILLRNLGPKKEVGNRTNYLLVELQLLW